MSIDEKSDLFFTEELKSISEDYDVNATFSSNIKKNLSESIPNSPSHEANTSPLSNLSGSQGTYFQHKTMGKSKYVDMGIKAHLKQANSRHKDDINFYN
jgi:hypothetical protein